MRTRTTRTVLTMWVTAVSAIAWLAAVRPALAQTPFVPYFGKNLVRYDRFDWHIYTTEHFEIYYYTESQQHLERVAGYAESAYQKISADLKHDLAFKVPLITFMTHAEFEQENVIPGAAQEGVGAFAEPTRDRMLLPLDDPPDLLYRLITHELTHIFEFDIIPQGLVKRGVPLWVSEGLSDFIPGDWRPIDLMMVRDAAIADIVPKMSELEGYGSTSNPRLVYNMGHACFEFMESRWGKEGIRQFLFALRKSVIGGGESAYKEAFQLDGDDFDQQFDKYLKDRFKPFRDKERPADYGKNMAPRAEKGNYIGALTIEPSPSGDLLAAATLNKKEREVDIVLMSAKDGKVIRNLTPGFDQGMGFDYLVTPGSRWITIPWISWAPAGDRIAYIARHERGKSLILQNVLTRDIEQRIDLNKKIDEPESPDISPDGRTVAVAGRVAAVGDIFTIDLQTSEIVNLTKDAFDDYAPTFSPDGSFIVYISRISGNDKLFKLDLATHQKTQLTFGTHDDGAVQFIDNDTLLFPSTATDPNQVVEPEVARNGNIYNVWTLNLKNGELRQYTDVVTGNFSPVVVRDGKTTRYAFVTYYKGDYELHMLERKEPVATARTSDFGAPGPVIDFQAPLGHTLVPGNAKRKGTFEKMFLDGRPPVNVGVTSGGDLFGGTAISFSDVLGDRNFTFYAASMSQYRQFAFSMTNQERRFQYALQGYWLDEFFYGQSSTFYDPVYSPYINRDLAIATRSNRGVSAFGIYPLDRYRRLELTGGFGYVREAYNNTDLGQLAADYQQQLYGQALFRNGWFAPISAAFVQETTIFREFGPLQGNTMRLSYTVAPPVTKTLAWQTVDGDVRKYIRLGGSGLIAMRARAFHSWGRSPDFTYFGGNSEMRGYDYLQFVGQHAVFADAELRFPLIEAMATPIGVLGGIRGVFFFNVGGSWFDNSGYKFWSKKADTYTPITGVDFDPLTGAPIPIYGDPQPVSGFRLVDGRASYGIGLETFALGFPIHFDWSWRTLLNKQWEDLVFAGSGGSSAFRKPRFQFWIGYDF